MTFALQVPWGKTVYEVFQTAIKKHGARPFLGWRTVVKGAIGPYTFQTYKQVGERVAAVSSGLAAFDFAQGDRIGLYSINRAEWIIAELACGYQNLCTVPLYAILTFVVLSHMCGLFSPLSDYR